MASYKNPYSALKPNEGEAHSTPVAKPADAKPVTRSASKAKANGMESH